MPRDKVAPPKAASARASVVEHVVQHVRNGVRLGRYAPGQRLPEVDMTRELGISRGPLREAMARLAAEGVVEMEPHRGAMIKRLTEADLRELYDVREALEGQAAALAAKQVAAGMDAKALSDELRRLEVAKQVDDIATYMSENIAFHDLVVNLSGNRLLTSLVEQLHTNTFRVQLLNLIPPDGRDTSIRQHTEITKAILAGQHEEAEAAMRHHVRESYQMLARSFSTIFS
ncbi:GntR family transcriptional regulator [Mycolicibacterium pulveris]|uniref:GntR family transcriptional regulator n=1 Tax=Mycolicibacterium pulveris TaxID=36813 RepID=A0A7I7UP78_MYCPV|nr:GntR family transcriptional regulator [Mycolicibacterium pulveris]MCV6983283.1 GntR family transcriptional regulator [Mycolicibacterium pulveris]BBY83157.1 GntR family transcriptional regulator [Mycolicibacterium pulveris]